MPANRPAIPEAALSWLMPGSRRRVLTLGTGLARRLAWLGHDVFVVDRSASAVARVAGQPGITAVVAQAESLPFDPCQFEVVLAHQNFGRFAPGLVLSEMARVLRPGGHAGVSYLTRDDSVPWVRRLLRLVQSIDPDAMRGDYGGPAIDALLDSKYFPENEQSHYRHWVPTARAELVSMVAGLAAVKALDEPQRATLFDQVGALYDDAAPGSEPLRLPYQLLCHRAWVSHTELTAPIEIDDDGLVIRL